MKCLIRKSRIDPSIATPESLYVGEEHGAAAIGRFDTNGNPKRPLPFDHPGDHGIHAVLGFADLREIDQCVAVGGARTELDMLIPDSFGEGFDGFLVYPGVDLAVAESHYCAAFQLF